jgi:DNA-binding transcriptional regulator YdaS (Cro superfamily)
MAETSASRIITKFGGQSSLARALGMKQSTVSHWAKTGTVPARWHSKIIQAAADQGLSVEASDLVSTPTIIKVRPSEVPTAIVGKVLVVGDADDVSYSVSCYVLNDGRRVISRTSALGALAKSDERVVGGDLQRYVKPAQEFLRVKLEDELIEFLLDNVANKKVYGITAECFLEICRAFVRADNAGALRTEVALDIARNASAFLAACANVGLIALIDEATGYQYMRANDALQVKLKAYLEEEIRPWEKTFPDELWMEFGRLTNWRGNVQNRPKYWGHLVNELIYRYLDPDVYDWLKNNAPAPRHGRNYHQWLSDQYGLKKLMEHIWMVIGMAAACHNMTELKYRMAERFGKQPFQYMLFIDPPRSLQEA